MARKSKKPGKDQTTPSAGDDASGSQPVPSADGYTQQLETYLTQLADLRRRGASEDSIRDAFLQFLRHAFPRMDQADPILLEKHIPALRVRGGYADALYGDLIFEFKRRLDDASRTEGREELTRYVRNQQHPERYLGILTDGETLEVNALRGGDLDRVDQLTLSSERAADAKLWLDCYLFHEKNLVPTANDVALRFGERSLTFWQSLRVLGEMWRQVGPDAMAQTKLVEWQSLLSIVYGSAVGDEGLFLRHTYLALFARGLAFAALERRAPDHGEISGILTGGAFETMGFENFVGDDFFTWMSDPSVFPQARGLLHVLGTRLTAAYDLTAVREDLLKELYQELVDPQTRHDLGEFYTPDWLAELTLRKAGFPPPPSPGGRGAAGDEARPEDASLFDPSCGSGTFLFTAVRLLRESGRRGKHLVHFCMNHLAGIDVHPLAVTIAKTNLLLALSDDLRLHKEAASLPIFLADSLSPGKPKLRPHSEHQVISISVDAESIAARAEKPKPAALYQVFEIPAALADQPDMLRQCLDALLAFANPNTDEKHAAEGLLTRLRQLGAGDAQWHEWASNLRLMRWLLAPPVTNSVWRFILHNAYQPELLARRKFAFVAGNPPWLAYRYIQRADYQKRVRDLVFDYDLLQKKQAHLFTQMELATLFFAFCEDRFLREGGTLAFVMPRSVLTGAKQHARFQERYLAAADRLIDCEQVTPLFNVPACVVMLRKRPADQPEEAASSPIALLHLQAQLPTRNASLAQAQKHWQESEGTFSPLAAREISPYWSDIVQGASLAPRCAWFVRPPEIARIIDRRRPHLETDRATEHNAKKPWKGIRLTGSVEADFLYATLLSDNMLPFGWRQLSAVVLPVVGEKRGGLRMLNEQEAIRRGHVGLANWLREAEEVWSQYAKSSDRVPTIYHRLDFGQCLTRQRPTGVAKLIYNKSGTHLCACAVDAGRAGSWRVGQLRARGFVSDYGTYWLERDRADEVHYLCALLNAPLVDEAIKPYQTKGAFGAQHGGGERDIHRRPFEVLPIPQFDAKDKRHRRLAKLGERCHEKVGQVVAQAEADGDEHFFTAPIGRLRTALRKELLAAELAEIDVLVGEILGT